jgi:hypothetical protein
MMLLLTADCRLALARCFLTQRDHLVHCVKLGLPESFLGQIAHLKTSNQPSAMSRKDCRARQTDRATHRPADA